MKRKNRFASKAVTAGLVVAAVAALGLSGVTGARAALTYFSDTYTSQAQMYDIGISLMEKSGNETKYTRVGNRDYTGEGTWDEKATKLLENLDETIVPGVTYNEAIAVENSGTIDEYVRVIIRKYWIKPEDPDHLEDTKWVKTQKLDPGLIQLHFTDETDEKWMIDQNSSTKERTILYYNDLLETGEMTTPLCDTLTIDGQIATKVTETTTTEGGYTTITTTYDYDGYRFVLEARAEAIQDHNANDAAISAWGLNYANFTD